MTWYGTHPPLRVADDPADPVWQWFLQNGPHGERFEWHGTLGDIYHLRKFIAERTEGDPLFPDRARDVALRALENEDAVVVRTGIQVLTVVGEEEDLKLIESFLEHQDVNVAKDARCCLFERGYKRGRKSK